MNAEVNWKGRLSFTGTADSGFDVPLGSFPEVGGDNDGFRPMELIAVGLAGCTGMDVISILKKKRQDVREFEVSAKVESADQHPKVFTKIKLTYHVTGKEIDRSAVERAVELSEKRYCGAKAMLQKTAEITNEIVIDEID